MKDQKFTPAVPLTAFASELRNIRASMDGTAWTLDLIPSAVVDHPVGKATPSSNPTDDQFNKMLEGAHPIVEARKLLRVQLHSVQACVVQEEFVELFDTFDVDPKHMPLLQSGRGYFPFLLVGNSSWRATLPDYEGGDWPDLKHYMFFSMETHVNVLGILESFEWVRNPWGG